MLLILPFVRASVASSYSFLFNKVVGDEYLNQTTHVEHCFIANASLIASTYNCAGSKKCERAIQAFREHGSCWASSQH